MKAKGLDFEKAVEQKLLSMHEDVLKQNLQSEEFTAKNRQTWFKGFAASEELYVMAVKAAEDCGAYAEALFIRQNEELRAKARGKAKKQPQPLTRPYRYTALRGLQNRACQQYAEVIYLLKGGFVDAAVARWRSLYRLAVTAELIAQNDEALAEDFLAAPVGCHNWAKRLLAESEAAEAEADHREADLSFDDLAALAKQKDSGLYRLYQEAEAAEAYTARANYYELAEYGGSGVILYGRSNYGMWTPAEAAAELLVGITQQYLSFFDDAEGELNIKCLQEWLKLIRKSYLQIRNSFNQNRPVEVADANGLRLKKDAATDEDCRG